MQVCGFAVLHWLVDTLLLAHEQIALQVALTFAKVARLDYPAAWPSLFGGWLQRRPTCCIGSSFKQNYNCLLLILQTMWSEVWAERRLSPSCACQVTCLGG